MNLFLSVAAWGDKNVDLLTRYSFPSLLSPNNIPALARNHSITVHIATSRKDYARLAEHQVLRSLADHCAIAWDKFEDLHLSAAPGPKEGRKYSFVTALQSLSMKRAAEHDAIVFNYADFVWADGALPGSIALLADGVDAVLGFGAPVDLGRGRAALDPFCSGDVLTIAPRELARIGLDCLHREATYRFWDAPTFTNCPSYLFFPVGQEGAVVRAYHQTAFVLRVMPDDPAYQRGIATGTLDGNYTADIARRGRVVHATDSDAVMVFSLHDGIVDSRLRGNSNRDAVMRKFVGTRLELEQLRFAETPMRIKSGFSGEGAWRAVEVASERALARVRVEAGR